MGFPLWTLVGMGLSVVGAIFFTLLAYIAQSPRTLMQFGLVGYHLELRVKMFTGISLACLLLLMGFFIAGVPLEPILGETAVATPTPATVVAAQNPVPAATQPLTTADNTPQAATQAEGTRIPSSGAFGGPPPSAQTEAAPLEAGGTAVSSPTAVPNTPEPIDESTRPAETPTPTTTPSPTPTATPTITPTPIEGATAVIDIGSGTIWVHRSPGGQQLALAANGDVVILENGRANRDGRIWQKIRTVKGLTGWVEAQFLAFEE